ncbi:hypothetical protein SISSUDRAFT_1048158 [Sistotremastrum suecicum HHB10207 ss-3]|uniref:Uncharacterized protein n=1 Tax=Sistotremastrum suecicum HHB10207 ss-3 TaxID=1314776 RepID=A0A166CN04_9AGAM|nr:hypothetical protein SISSUDRAFT_1048158 [Sistotremastrum suecicum HHB10207 ss-3]
MVTCPIFWVHSSSFSRSSASSLLLCRSRLASSRLPRVSSFVHLASEPASFGSKYFGSRTRPSDRLIRIADPIYPTIPGDPVLFRPRGSMIPLILGSSSGQSHPPIVEHQILCPRPPPSARTSC